MQKSNLQTDQETLKKLRRKAELCRFSHSELKEKYSTCRNWKELVIALLSVISAVLIGFHFRGMLKGDLVQSIIFVLPLVIALVQTIDLTVFQCTRKAARHESAVTIWGDWIREADFIEKRICQYSRGLANEKMQNLQEKYNNCMSSTEQIPNSMFLKFKEKFRTYVLMSKKIDQMSLEELEIGK